MASFPVEVLFGLYLGILTGIVPALVSWAFGFVFKYVTGVTVPAFGVVVLSVAIAGVNGGLLALNDPTFTQSANQVRLSVAVIVVLMLSLYAHNAGDKMGAEFPRKLSLRRLTDRTLSTDVIELVGGRGQVAVRVSGDVGDMEGYPAVPADLRREIREWTATFPADVPVVELEGRVADRLRTEFDLADVAVTLDERARATVNAAPPLGGLSKRVPAGKRGVSVRALLPTGTARGDEIALATPDRTYRGEVLSLRSDRAAERTADVTDGGTEPAPDPAATPSLPVADGGDGRVTVAVDTGQASSLLGSTVERLSIQSRGTRREYELLSLLRRAGNRIRKVTLREGAPLAGTTIGDAALRDAYGVTVLAVRHAGRWQFAPRGSQALDAGDDLFVVGSYDAVTAFREAVA
ncbi:potassium channel family protein [Haloplanus rubicundus]|uniref:Potassium transporter TrkA n=1 Tax=Haloplanus rubicundus TaxID=1547898 RepID=A0A345EH68_9EURY|nr:TrkA C-terminal domain-containing protein [Haloplanus rubicundus]AXG11540.1 potassium transporter TrkA [Haloplanus rubicundus]